VLTLYQGSGSGELDLLRTEAKAEQWLALKDAAVRLLRARGRERAAELLYLFPWEIWEATNSFNDEFYTLYFTTSPEEYARLGEAKAFDRHEFSAIAEAVTEVSSFYIRFISVGAVATARSADAGSAPPGQQSSAGAREDPEREIAAGEMPATFDVAISFAGTERPHAQQLAVALRTRGIAVFYDNFYAEELWGKDLAAFFDDVFRKRASYCVMFISREYADRMWTTHERKSAMARAVVERQREYILPIRVDDTDLPGLPSSIGHLSLQDHSITRIAELLVRKLRR
jgi:hypothetical protein